MALQIAILGSVEPRVNGSVVSVPAGKQRALLALLAARAPQPVSADSAAEALWPRAAPAEAVRSLQVTVSRLRRSLGAAGSALETVASGYRLAVEPDAIDARRFEALLADARTARVEGDAAAARRLLDDGLGLWRGPALADVGYESFAQGEIARLEELRVAALEERIDARVSEGEHALVVAELEQLAAEHPSRERLVGLLMLALYRCGRQTDALEVYTRGRVRLDEELGLEPSPELQRLQEAILRHDPSLREPSTSGTAPVAPRAPPARDAVPPAPATRLIGREREREEMVDLICSDDARLVTLVGPGGVGKTRLALELASAAMPRFRDGAAWVELAAVGRAEHVPGTVARALGVVPLPGEPPEEALLLVLEAKQLLLVIDNFEHVLEAAPLVAQLVAHCASLTVLATSREALDLAAEHVCPVAPLALPAGGERLTAAGVEASPAGALFLAAARRHDPSLRVGDGGARAIAEICMRLDGLPLAIELAAARARLLSLESLAARLDRALATLASGPRDAPERQRTLRAAIDWSYQLLGSREQAAFARFAVFAGGATLEDAEAITDADLDTLDGLVRKHLLRRSAGPGSEARLLMLETVREYARELLDAAQDETAVRARHCRRYLGLATQAERHLFTHREPEWLTRLETEIDNIRTALDWALDREPQLALRLAGVLGKYWEAARRAHEGVRWLRAALESAGPAAPIGDRARGHVKLARVLEIEDRRDDAKTNLTHALALARESGDHALIADALLLLSEVALESDLEKARALAIEGLAHARSANDEGLIAMAVSVRANTSLLGEQADDEFHEAAEALRNVGDRWHLAGFNIGAAYQAIIHGSYAHAAKLLDETLLLARDSSTSLGGCCSSGEPRARSALHGRRRGRADRV